MEKRTRCVDCIIVKQDILLYISHRFLFPILFFSLHSHPDAHWYWIVDPTAPLPCTESRSSSSGKVQDTSGTRTGSAAKSPPGEAGGRIKIAYLSLHFSMHCYSDLADKHMCKVLRNVLFVFMFLIVLKTLYIIFWKVSI